MSDLSTDAMIVLRKLCKAGQNGLDVQGMSSDLVGDPVRAMAVLLDAGYAIFDEDHKKSFTTSSGRNRNTGNA